MKKHQQQKKIKLFLKENIVINKKYNRKPDIWFKDNNIIFDIHEGNHENYDSDDEKEREDMFKKHNFKIFQCNSNNPEFTKKYQKFLDKSIYFWLAFESYCFHGHT